MKKRSNNVLEVYTFYRVIASFITAFQFLLYFYPIEIRDIDSNNPKR